MLVTSDDGTCGNDTAIYVFEHVLFNPRLDIVDNFHIEVLRQIAAQIECMQTRDMLDGLAVYLRQGDAAPLQAGHLRATVRRYSGREDQEGRIIGLLSPDDEAPTPEVRRHRSQYDQRIDIDVLFMPWWLMAGRLSAPWHHHIEPSSRPLSTTSVTPSSPESDSATSSSGSDFLYTEDP